MRREGGIILKLRGCSFSETRRTKNEFTFFAYRPKVLCGAVKVPIKTDVYFREIGAQRLLW